MAIEIEFAENTAIDPKLVKLKTSKGIHLGSSMADCARKYGLGPPSGGEAGLSRAIVKKGNRCTLFYAPTPPYHEDRGDPGRDLRRGRARLASSRPRAVMSWTMMVPVTRGSMPADARSAGSTDS